MGAHATWRAAMAVFGYPENSLLPTLRTAQDQTTAFKTLVTELRSKLRLTPIQARAAAATYLTQLRAERTDLPAALKSVTFTITEQFSEAQLAARGNFVRARFTEKGITNPHLAPNYLKEVGYFVPMLLGLHLQKSGEYLAALDWLQTVYAHNLPVNKRKVYYGLTLEENLTPEFSRTDDWLLRSLNPTRASPSSRWCAVCWNLPTRSSPVIPVNRSLVPARCM
jgi:hypothetical protein